MDVVSDFLKEKLDKRLLDNSLRELSVSKQLIDFCSNDYLGLAKIREGKGVELFEGATGSRLLTGNYVEIEQFEQRMALFFNAEAGLYFNSGYTANIGLLPCVASRHDTYVCDELCHASIVDGVRLSNAGSFKFKHNDMLDLESKIKKAKGRIFVVIESVYSMDGDLADLVNIVAICEKWDAYMIIDEAHSGGVFGGAGAGLVDELGVSKKNILAQVFTFGKAFGSHGAVVVGSVVLRDYLINYSRAFIYTTAPTKSHVNELNYQFDKFCQTEYNNLLFSKLCKLLKVNLRFELVGRLLGGESPICGVIIEGNDRVKRLADKIQLDGFDVRPILSPTVKKGKERLRICLHLFNTEQEVLGLVKSINENYEK